MKNRKLVLGVLGGIATVIVISVFGATSAGTRCYDPTLMASWLQAIGSIAAIFVAIWIGTWQAGHARELAESQQKKLTDEKWHGALAIVSAIEDLANRVYVDLDFDEPLTYNPDWLFKDKYRESDFSDLDSSLSSIPLHELPYAMAAHRFISIRRNFKLLREKLRQAIGDHDSVQGAEYKSAFFADIYAEALEIVRDIRDDADGVRLRYTEARDA